MKRCKECGVAKKLSAYLKKFDKVQGKAYYYGQCRECDSKDVAKRYQLKTPEQKLKAKDRTLQRLYGITIEDYNRMFENQQGKCAACRKHQSEFSKALVVDHCHDSKKVRGLLCSGCNLAAGNVDESISALKGLISYLEGHLQCA